jgi:hypothetical protein
MSAAAHCLQLAGLVVGFAGALLLTISQRPGEIYQGTGRGEVAYIVLGYPRLWKLGLGCSLPVSWSNFSERWSDDRRPVRPQEH